MPLHRLTEVELRQICKEAVEALEFWLRRVIDITLSSEFGHNYLNAKWSTNNQYLIKKDVRESVRNRALADANRYPRMVDALLLDGSMPFRVELDNLKDTDVPIHPPAASPVATD